MGRRCPSSMSSGKAIDASVVSRPLAVPALDPASGTRFMGAFPRSSYPDLTRLFDTDSLLAPSGHQLHFMSGKKVQILPNFGNKVVDIVPSKRAVGDAAKPAQLVGGIDERMRMEVIRDRDTGVSERGCDKAYTEIRRTGTRRSCQRGGRIWRRLGRLWGREGVK